MNEILDWQSYWYYKTIKDIPPTQKEYENYVHCEYRMNYDKFQNNKSEAVYLFPLSEYHLDENNKLRR